MMRQTESSAASAEPIERVPGIGEGSSRVSTGRPNCSPNCDLRQGAITAADRDDCQGGARDQCVARLADAGRDRDRHKAVGSIPLDVRQEPDRNPARRGDALAGCLLLT